MAQALAEVGIQGIALMDIKRDLGDHAAEELSSQTGVDVRFYQVDVRDPTTVSNAIDDVVNQFGKIDILVSSAGIAEYTSLSGLTYCQFTN